MTTLPSTTTVPWVEKYRPTSISDILGHTQIIQTLCAFLAKGELPHLLLYGPPGTGKTSVVQALARALHEEHVLAKMVLELNASDDRGIGTVRTQIKTFAETKAPITGTAAPSTRTDLRAFFKAPARRSARNLKVNPSLRTLKLVILDECDQMTAAAQTALRRIMEKYARHVRFCLICNDIGKITPPIQSRCSKFRFAPLPRKYISGKLSEVIESENIRINEDGIDELLNISHGDFRRLLNTLQACCLSHPDDEIRSVHILSSLGLPSREELDAIYTTLKSEPFEKAFDRTAAW